jgi:hypothetical protein
MKTNNRGQILRATVVVIALAMGAFAAGDKVLLEWDFGAGADSGPAIIADSWGVVAADPATGRLQCGTANNGHATFTSETPVDASGAENFTITWTVASFTTNGVTTQPIWHEGHVYGVTKPQGGGFKGTYPALGISVDNGNSGLGTWKFCEVTGTGAKVQHALNGSAPTYASKNDGFTLTMTVNADNTWEVSSTGLSNTETTTGTLTGVTYAEISSNLYPNCTLGGVGTTVYVDHVVLSSYTTPAGTVIIIR